MTDSQTLSIADRRQRIRAAMLAASRTIQMPNFLRIADGDLRVLFDQYDAMFFQHELRDTLLARGIGRCQLGWSNRLRSSGGITRRWKDRTGVHYEIALSSTLLMNNFRDGKPCVLCGFACNDRLDAMMRIFEHELLHLLEFLRYDNSRCAARRFQLLARQYFGHTAHQHRMTTERQRTLANTALRPGMRVRFSVEGTLLNGIINRINKRATVLVEHPAGQPYSNGKRYAKYYVPVALIKPENEPGRA